MRMNYIFLLALLLIGCVRNANIREGFRTQNRNLNLDSIYFESEKKMMKIAIASHPKDLSVVMKEFVDRCYYIENGNIILSLNNNIVDTIKDIDYIEVSESSYFMPIKKQLKYHLSPGRFLIINDADSFQFIDGKLINLNNSCAKIKNVKLICTSVI